MGVAICISVRRSKYWGTRVIISRLVYACLWYWLAAAWAIICRSIVDNAFIRGRNETVCPTVILPAASPSDVDAVELRMLNSSHLAFGVLSRVHTVTREQYKTTAEGPL